MWWIFNKKNRKIKAHIGLITLSGICFVRQGLLLFGDLGILGSCININKNKEKKDITEREGKRWPIKAEPLSQKSRCPENIQKIF